MVGDEEVAGTLAPSHHRSTPGDSVAAGKALPALSSPRENPSASEEERPPSAQPPGERAAGPVPMLLVFPFPYVQDAGAGRGRVTPTAWARAVQTEPGSPSAEQSFPHPVLMGTSSLRSSQTSRKQLLKSKRQNESKKNQN